VTKFCLWVDIQDVITWATFGDDRLKGLDVAMGRISLFPIDLRRRPYNTIALRASVWSPFVQKVQTLKKNNKRNDTNYN